ncbi:MAG: MFS transporter [Chloroflexota bacterium]
MTKSSSFPLSRDARLYLVIPFVLGFSWLGLFVVLFNLFLLRLGYGPSFIGMLTAIGPIMFILLSIPSGLMSRRFGSRRLIILALSIYAVSFTLLPWGDVLPSPWREAWFMTWLLMAYVGGAFYWPNGDVYLMSITEDANRSRAFAYRQALFPLAGFIGSLLAGQLPSFFAKLIGTSIEQPAPYRYALMLCGLVHIASVLAMMLTSREVSQEEVTESKAEGQGKWVLVWSVLIPLAFVELLWKGGTQGPTNFFNVFLDLNFQVSPQRIGMILGVGQLVAAGLALATPWLARRIGHGRIIALALVGLISGLFIIAGSSGWLGASSGFVLFQVLAAISTASVAVYRMEKVDARWWGWASGIAVAAQGIGESSIYYAGGVVIERFGFDAFFLGTASVLAVGLTFFVVYFKPFRRPSAASEQPQWTEAPPSKQFPEQSDNRP